MTVPQGHYFVLGDNRPFSSDSREWGFVPRKNIIGKVWFCYYNCDKKDFLDRNNLNVVQNIGKQVTPTGLSTSVEKRIDPNLYDVIEELDNFPIYPNSLFVKKQYYSPCPNEERSGYSIACDSVAYTWQTKDDFDQVFDWFKKDSLKTGWVCQGGGGQYGGPRSASGNAFCRRDSVTRKIYISADEVKTEYILEVPMSQYKGKTISY